jgi:DNA-binding MarR family transcriptional regulator
LKVLAEHPEPEVFLAILKTADALMTEVAEFLKPHGVSPTQYNVLRILRAAAAVGRRNDGRAGAEAGISCGEIAERMLTHDPDMTRLLDRLEARGLLMRQRGTDDRRRVTTSITGAGLEVLRAIDQPLLDLHRRQLGHVGPKKLGELLDLLDEVRRRCQGTAQ